VVVDVRVAALRNFARWDLLVVGQHRAVMSQSSSSPRISRPVGPANWTKSKYCQNPQAFAGPLITLWIAGQTKQGAELGCLEEAVARYGVRILARDMRVSVVCRPGGFPSCEHAAGDGKHTEDRLECSSSKRALLCDKRAATGKYSTTSGTVHTGDWRDKVTKA
jgi:hypothetical protein